MKGLVAGLKTSMSAINAIKNIDLVGFASIVDSLPKYDFLSTISTDNFSVEEAEKLFDEGEITQQDVNEELVGDAAITYTGTTATIKVGGSFKTFTPAFRNESVTVDKWTVSDENGDISGDTENYTIKYSGDKLQLKVALNYNLIGKILMIQLIGSDKSVAQLSVGVV
jgi:hypothetical protein